MFKGAFFVFSVLAIGVPHFARANVPFSDCGSVDGTVNSVEITDCSETDKRCILKRNTNSTIVIDFTANKGSDELKVHVYGIMLDIPTPFPLNNPDACKDSGIECPLVAGNTYKYTTTLPILKTYPRVTVDIKFILKSDKDFVCILIPAKIN